MPNFKVTTLVYGAPGEQRREHEIIEAAKMEVGIGADHGGPLKYPVEQGSLVFYDEGGGIKAIRRNWNELDRMD